MWRPCLSTVSLALRRCMIVWLAGARPHARPVGLTSTSVAQNGPLGEHRCTSTPAAARPKAVVHRRALPAQSYAREGCHHSLWHSSRLGHSSCSAVACRLAAALVGVAGIHACPFVWLLGVLKAPHRGQCCLFVASDVNSVLWLEGAFGPFPGQAWTTPGRRLWLPGVKQGGLWLSARVWCE